MTADADRVHAYDGPAVDHPRVPASPLASLAAHSRARPTDPFLTAVSADGDTTELTYGALDVLTRRVASWARRELGAGPGGVLGLLPANDAPSVLAIIGLLRSGAELLLLNPADPPARIDEQARALDARVLRPEAAATEARAVPIPDPATLGEGRPADPEVPADPGATALYFGTSGSTAASKLVAQSHGNAAVNAYAVVRHHGLRPGQRVLGCLPIHHVNGLHFTLLTTLTAGAHAILAHAFDPFGYPRLIERFRPRLASVAPSVLEALVATWREPALPSEFEYFLSAAAPLTAQTQAAVGSSLGARVVQGYGLTETTNFSTTMPPTVGPATQRSLVAATDIPSVGVALYGNDVAVLTPDEEVAAAGEVGEICMRGQNVMKGYAGNAEATADAVRGGWFHSGDLGIALPEPATGRTFFAVTGRIKNMAKVRGESVSLEEMERVVRAIPGVVDAACVTVPHRLVGEEIMAGVVVSDPERPPEIRAQLTARFATAVIPRRVVALDSIPRTPTGKVRRAQLAERLGASG